MTIYAPKKGIPTVTERFAAHSRFTRIILGITAFALGLCAVYVIRAYAHDNLTALQLKGTTKAAREYAIDLLIASNIAIFFVAAMLAKTSDWTRARLLLLGFAIWGYDAAVLYQSRVGIVQQQTIASDNGIDQAKQLRDGIASHRAAAQSLRTSAAGQAASIFKESRMAGLEALKEAKAEDAKADELAKQLHANNKAIAPTEADTWGVFTKYKMFAEALLISFVDLMMFSLSGVILSSFTTKQAVPDVPAPVSPVPAPESTSLLGRRSITAGILGAGVAAMGGGTAMAQSVPVPAPVPASPVPVPDDFQLVPPSVPHGYEYVKQSVLAGEILPTVREVKVLLKCGQTTAQNHIDRLKEQGVIAANKGGVA